MSTAIKEEHWLKQYWRPTMAYQYLIVCLFDFIIGPLLAFGYAYLTKEPYVPWAPLTLGEGGFYHLSMAAIIGVAAWTRGQEKIKRADVYGNSDSTTTIETTQTPQ